MIEDFVDTTDANKKDAEAYAVGTRGGTDVPDTDPTYHNNAKYYAGQASADAEAAEAAKTTAVSTVETAIGNIRTEGTTQVSAVQTKGAEVLASIPDDYETLSTDVSALKSEITKKLYDKAPIIISSASGAIASFSDGADDYPFKKIDVSIDPVQAGSGDPSPDNVRPITGFDKVEVTRTGKNLLPMPITSGSYIYGTTITVNDDLSFIITKSNGNGWTKFQLGDVLLKAGVYTLIEDDDESTNATISITDLSSNELIVYTRYSKKRIINFIKDTKVRIEYSRSATADNVLTKLMLFMGDTATKEDYEPYQGQNYSITLPSEAGTVYGGILTINGDGTGELVVTRFCDDGGNLNWIKAVNSQYRTFYTSVSYDRVYNTYRPTVITSIYKSVSNNSASAAEDNYIWAWGNGNKVIAIKDTSKAEMTSEEFKTFMTGVPIVYELATPQTYNFTAHQIKTLLGANNIFADTGDVLVNYPADTKLYIDEKIAELQATVLENIGG